MRKNLAVLFLVLVFVAAGAVGIFTASMSYANTITIDFTYSNAVDFTGEGVTIASQSGAFSFAQSSSPIVGLSDLSSFTNTVTFSAPFGTSTYNFGKGDITSFAYDYGAGSPSLSLTTGVVNGSNPQLTPLYFSVTNNYAVVYNVSGFPLGSSTIILSAVPLPATLLLFGPGLVGLAAVRRRFKK